MSANTSRYVVLDTETTGLETQLEHRIIEIGAVEVVERRLTGNNFHEYINPQRAIDAGAQEVHGITVEFLEDKPLFSDILSRFVDYVDGATLIIHNAPFDVGFINYEFSRHGYDRPIESHCEILDSLAFARERYPGQRNSLDALCKRLDIDNSHRTLHGALLDAEILADVYLRMTGGQTALALDWDGGNVEDFVDTSGSESAAAGELLVVQASAEELAAHQQWLERLSDAPEGCRWTRLEQKGSDGEAAPAPVTESDDAATP